MATTTENGVVYANLGLKGSALAAASYTTAVASATTSLRTYANSVVSASQAAETDSAFATEVMTNLGLTAAVIGQAAYDALQPALAAYVNSVGVANRGVVVVQLSQIVAGLTSDATYGKAAANITSAAASAYTYSTTAANTTDKAITVIPTGGQFVLTTSANDITGTTVNDTIDGTVVNSLSDTDKIIDAFTTDHDVLNAVMNAASTATVKNIEEVNITWTSNADMAVTATNMAGNGLNLKATGLAYSGVATVTDAGDNNVTAGTGVTALTLTNVLTSKVDAGAAAKVTLDKIAAVPTVGQKTTADITLNKSAVTLTNTAADQVEVLKVGSTVDSTVTLSDGAAGTAISTSLEATGSKNLTFKGVVTGSKITNSLTGGATLSVVSTDAGAINLTKIGANLITLAGAGAAVTVVDNQKLALTTGGAATSLVANAGLTNVTTSLSTSVDVAGLNITGITNLNLDVAKDATIGLTTNAGNNIVVTGSGANTLTVTGVAAVDASAATGKQAITASNNNSGIVGSATASNTIDGTAVATANLTAIGGAAADTVTISTNTGTVSIKTAAGNDTIKVTGANTGTVTIDGGDDTDTLSITAVTGVASAAGVSKVSWSNIEKIVAVTGTDFNNVQLSGSTVTLSSTSANATVNVFAYDKTGTATTATTDLSTLTIGNVTGANVKTVNITGLDNVVDSIKGTTVADVIDAGTKGDKIDISQGGTDTIVVNVGDSTYTAALNNMDSVTGFNAATATTADTLDFATAAKATAQAALDVKASITGGTGTEVVNAVIDASGILTVSGVNADKIDTLVEWMSVAKAAIEGAGAAAAAAGETLAFQFNGNTYVYNVGTTDAVAPATTGAITAADIVELVGVTGVTAVGTVAAANTVLIA